MNKLEVLSLLIDIKANYGQVNTSDAEVERMLEYLHDIPYEMARENVRQHIMICDFPPKISQIRGRQGDQIEHERLKAETAIFLAERDAARAAAVPPPPGWKENIHAILGIKRTTE